MKKMMDIFLEIAENDRQVQVARALNDLVKGLKKSARKNKAQGVADIHATGGKTFWNASTVRFADDSFVNDLKSAFDAAGKKIDKLGIKRLHVFVNFIPGNITWEIRKLS